MYFISQDNEKKAWPIKWQSRSLPPNFSISVLCRILSGRLLPPTGLFCIGLCLGEGRKKSEKVAVFSLQIPKWGKIPAVERSRPSGPVPPRRHCLQISPLGPNPFRRPAQLFPFPHRAQRDPALCSSPRSGKAPSATPVKARQTSGSEKEREPPPRGPRAPATSATSSYFRFSSWSKYDFPGVPPTSESHLLKCRSKRLDSRTFRLLTS